MPTYLCDNFLPLFRYGRNGEVLLQAIGSTKHIEQAFYSAAAIWKKIPEIIRRVQSLKFLKRSLKTHLFAKNCKF